VCLNITKGHNYSATQYNISAGFIDEIIAFITTFYGHQDFFLTIGEKGGYSVLGMGLIIGPW
jgi:hypothetical protein